MAEFDDLTYLSADGRLTLHARDYGVPTGPEATGRVVLCMHGLTRNSADFHDLAMHLKDRFRVISADQRGRGRSQWDPDPKNYTPAVYVQDMIRLLDHLAVGKAIAIGTSMGGLMAMIMGVAHRDRLLGAVINDVGPEIDPAGLARIAAYTGKTRPATNWAEAAELARFTNGVAFPDYGPADWMAFARRLYAEDQNGVPVLAYDPAISKGLETRTDAPVVPPDLWPMWDGLKELPIMAVRGALSDLLSDATLRRMEERHPGLHSLVVPGRGHAPMLDEPGVPQAIDAFLAGLLVPA